ncbi:MAG: nucleoside 2-deoxyribosyltransferase [Actinomycetota bacterium]|nr:nucleoside 2-deoxyribosyltransferase [Actinomycetota bacterium]
MLAVADDLPVPVYVAGPDGFTPAGLQWHRQILIPAVQAAGLDPLSPWGAASMSATVIPESAFAEVEAMPLGTQRLLRYQDLDYRTGAANAALIDRCHGVLAVLDGPDVDSGTAAEIGYAVRGRVPVVGLRTDSRRTGDNDGVTVNLQVEFFIRLSGGSLHRQLDHAVADLAKLVRPA